MGQLDALSNLLVQASLRGEPSPTVALDGMDYESFARPEYTDRKTGEIHPSKDSDARWGQRTTTLNHPAEYFFGYEIHTTTWVLPRSGIAPCPHLVASFVLRPGTTARAHAGAACVLAAHQHLPLTECLPDRGYTQLAFETFGLPLRTEGIHIVMDLKSQQRYARSASVAGLVLVDGHPFTEALPQKLRDLTPPAIQDPAEVKSLVHETYDKRKPYAFVPHGKLNTRTGSQRFRGPAHPRVRQLRCPNWPQSMRLPPGEVTTSTCRKGTPCACGAVITLRLEDDLHLRQRDPFGTTAWKASYSRRVAIESSNAELRGHRTLFRRGYTCVFGLAKNAILLALGIAGQNIRLLHDWHDIRGLDDPWSVQLNEPPDTRPRQRRIPKKPRLTLLERYRAHGPPSVARHGS